MTVRNLIFLALGAAFVMQLSVRESLADTAAVETIVMVRHGEKPQQGLGQLDCQGLNRALALPAVIRTMFGRPAAIFAPNPSVQKIDDGFAYDYVRPLATIEPTAIAFGLPVDASIGLTDIETLKARLIDPKFQNAFVLVGWEHNQIVQLARNIMSAFGGDSASVPQWKGSDFDSIYVIRITRGGTGTTAAFERYQEGLNHQPAACPGQ
ncbi:MAG TPA: hypothetical protein VGJ31_13850 [Dongiaceae bacterium]